MPDRQIYFDFSKDGTLTNDLEILEFIREIKVYTIFAYNFLNKK